MGEEFAGVDGLIKTTLLSLGVPVERLRYTGKASVYITFQYLLGRKTGFADDDGTAYEHFYRVDIFSKADYIGLLRRAESALEAAGAYGITVLAEIYENDTGFYHIPLEFYITEV